MARDAQYKSARPGRWSTRLALLGLAALYVIYAAFFQPNETQLVADATSDSLLATSEHHKTIVTATTELAAVFHYRNKPLTNEFSEEILTEYLEALDPQKAYFLASDIREFESNRFYFDNYLKKGSLDEVFSIYKIYQQRVQDRADYAIGMLEYSFDFALDEQIQLSRSDEDWPVSQSESDALWKSLVKDDILTLRLNGEDEARIPEILVSRYERFKSSVAQSNSFDVLEIFLNSYLKELDPHSEFFSPHSSSNLRISISQQIEGIGAMLRTEGEHTVVQGIITGGPAHLSKQLHEGDRIVAVSTGDGSIFQDIVGWRIEDVVDLIRGPRGTTVFLRILRKDASPGAPTETVELVRQNVKLEDQMAKRSTVEIESEGNILQLGVIQLPSFYSNFMESDDSDSVPSSSADDVKQFLIEFQQQDVDGLVFDLRGNGGGALREAVELTSMFIPSGPVVQVENSAKEVEVHSDNDGTVIYDGPLVVLVDRGSASASEIFAGAIQDYNRGIVVGETTFGKGTLQTIWPLSQLASDNADLGALKLSTAQFFRVSGTSTQHLGVTPDILFPTNAFLQESGERALENALPESEITPTVWWEETKLDGKIPEIRQLNRARMELNPLMAFLVERDRLTFHRDRPSVVSLNEEMRKQRLDSDRAEQLIFINEVRSLFGLEPTDSVSRDAVPTDRFDSVFLDEAINILADLVTLEIAESSS